MSFWTDKDRERERYRARLKWERDQKAFVDEAREQALKEGVCIGRIQFCQELLGLPVSPKKELAGQGIENCKTRRALSHSRFG